MEGIRENNYVEDDVVDRDEGPWLDQRQNP